MQGGLQSDIIHRMLPAIQIEIRISSKIVKIKKKYFYFTRFLCGSYSCFCVDLTAVVSPSDKIADSRPLRTECRGQYLALI
jgi:hypothetical protein